MEWITEIIPSALRDLVSQNWIQLPKPSLGFKRREAQALVADPAPQPVYDISIIPNEVLFRVFRQLNIFDLCSVAQVSKGHDSSPPNKVTFLLFLIAILCTGAFFRVLTYSNMLKITDWNSVVCHEGIWSRFPQRHRRIAVDAYPPLNVWSPFAVPAVFSLSLDPIKIRAYNFFNCNCSLPHRVYNKVWFGHKNRRRNCDCETMNNRLGWLVVFHIFLQYLLFFCVSATTIWSTRTSDRAAVKSILFAFVCGAANYCLCMMLKWYQTYNLYKSFVVFGCSLLMASSQQSPLGYQLFSMATSLLLLNHLLCTKTDHGYRYNLLLEIVIFHLIVQLQWMVYQVPSYALPLTSIALVPLTILLKVPFEYLFAYFLVFAAWGTLWLTTLGIIQHAQVYLDITIPIPLTRDIEFWVRCLFMPITSLQVFLPLDSTEHLERAAGIGVMQRYSLKYGHKVVSYTYLALFCLSVLQFTHIIGVHALIFKAVSSLLF